MARNLSLQMVSNVFNNVCIDNGKVVHLEPKVYTSIEKNLQYLCGDKRYKLAVNAGSNTSCMFTFMNVKYYVFYNWTNKKWETQYNRQY